MRVLFGIMHLIMQKRKPKLNMGIIYVLVRLKLVMFLIIWSRLSERKLEKFKNSQGEKGWEYVESVLYQNNNSFWKKWKRMNSNVMPCLNDYK